MPDFRVNGNLVLISPVGGGTVALGSQANGSGFTILLPTSIPQVGQFLMINSVYNGNTATAQWVTTDNVLVTTPQSANTVFLGPLSGSPAPPAFRPLAAADLGNAVFGASGVNHSAGAVPDPGSVVGATRFLREDATWAVPADSDPFVTSVFGRTGAVTAQAGDYTYAQIGGTPPAGNLVTETAAYAATASDHTINCDATGGAFTVTLPDAAGGVANGQEYSVKKIDSSPNAVTVAAAGGAVIDGSATFPILSQYESITVQWDAAAGHYWIY